MAWRAGEPAAVPEGPRVSEEVRLARAGAAAAAAAAPAEAAAGSGSGLRGVVGMSVLGVVYLDRAARESGDAELLGLLANQAAVALQNAQLYQMATVDALTGLYERRFLEQWLGRELRSALRSGQPLSLVMLDLDRFKQINDAAGRLVGDKALALVGKVLREATRDSDLAARYGGDELRLVLPNTPADGAAAVCERVLRLLEDATVEGPNGPVSVRVSIGCASLPASAFAPGEIPRPVPPEYFARWAGRWWPRPTKASTRPSGPAATARAWRSRWTGPRSARSSWSAGPEAAALRRRNGPGGARPTPPAARPGGRRGLPAARGRACRRPTPRPRARSRPRT